MNAKIYEMLVLIMDENTAIIRKKKLSGTIIQLQELIATTTKFTEKNSIL